MDRAGFWNQLSVRLGCGCAAVVAVLVLLGIVAVVVRIGPFANSSSSSAAGTAAYTPYGPSPQYLGKIHIVLTGQYAADINGHPTGACVQMQAGKVYYLVAEANTTDAVLIITMAGFPEQGSQHYPKAGTYLVPDPRSVTASSLILQALLRTASSLDGVAKPGGKLVVGGDGKSGSFAFDFDETSLSQQTIQVHATGTYQCI